jgi:putative redox protein
MRTAIASTTEAKLRQTVRIGPHVLAADEPAEDGGDDAGPAPHEFLLAGLAACTSMTVRLYAARKAWPLESVETSVDGDHVDGAFVLTRHVTLRGDLTDEQRARLLEIANKCPVHRSLTGPIRIATDLR